VAGWPLAIVADDGGRVDVAAALGTGGKRVAELLARLATASPLPAGADIAGLAAATPAGPRADVLALVGFAEAAEASADVDRDWLREVDRCRSAPRAALEAAGRGTELEAALNLGMLLATGPVDETPGAEDRVASGGRLWLLGGALAWALTGTNADPFACWAELVSYGLWPVGPVAGHLVVGVT